MKNVGVDDGDDDTSIKTIQDYYDRIGYKIGHPITIQGGVNKINSMQVGTTNDNSSVIVSCRGTTSTVYDWMKDSDSKLVPFIQQYYIPMQKKESIEVHANFSNNNMYETYTSLEDACNAGLDEEPDLDEAL